MFGQREEYPSVGFVAHVRQPTDTEPGLLSCTVDRDYLSDSLDRYLIEQTGATLEELASSDPREAYAHTYYLFRSRFIDTRDSDWGIGSAEQDGDFAHQGLVRYMEERRAPDPDIEEIDVVISVWKRPGFFERIGGMRHEAEEVVRFRVGPQNLAAA